jgi:hypothetical protein
VFGLIHPLPPDRAEAQGETAECNDIQAVLRLTASGFQQIRGNRMPDGRWAAARNVANYRSCSIVPLTQETFICETGAIPSANVQTFIDAKAAMLKSCLGSEWQQLPSIGGTEVFANIATSQMVSVMPFGTANADPIVALSIFQRRPPDGRTPR